MTGFKKVQVRTTVSKRVEKSMTIAEAKEKEELSTHKISISKSITKVSRNGQKD